MGLLRAIGMAFLALVLFFLALLIVGYIYYVSQPPKPVLAMNWPAGITYKGPDTTAIAGWYCIENINSSNYYSIQLNALLNNELGVQNTYGPSVSINGAWQPALVDNVWGQNSNGSLVLLHASNPVNDVVNAPCAWLVIVLKNGYAYFGYSLNGESITWYDSYPVNATYILPSGHTGIVLAGASNGEQAQLGRGTLVYLALYYWNGTGWAPAPVGVNQGLQTGETVNHAWEFTSGECGGYVAWFGWNETDWTTPVLPPNLEPVCPTPPSFKP